MARPHYRLNPHTLRYEPIQKGIWPRLRKGALYFFLALPLSAVGIFGILHLLGGSPLEFYHLRQENQRLLEQYENLNQELQNVDRMLGRIQERDDSLYRTIFGTEPIPENVRRSGIGGTDRYKHLKGSSRSDLLVQTHSKLDQVEKKIEVQKNSFQELMGLAQQKKRSLTHIPAIRPVREDRIDRVASGYGRRFHPIYRVFMMHEGIDFTLDIGTPIHATGDGVVKRLERSRAGYGRNIVIEHGNDYKTLYAHLSEFKVEKGQRVERGDVIGLSGNTGTSTGPHLHYEVIEDGEKVDPVDHFFHDLNPKEYQRLVKASERVERSL